VQQLALRFVKPEAPTVALPADVQQAVVTQMAQMIVDLIQKQQRSRDEHQTEQAGSGPAQQTNQQ
jgi:hypothetical protein